MSLNDRHLLRGHPLFSSRLCGSVRGSLTPVFSSQAPPKPSVVRKAGVGVAAGHGQDSYGFLGGLVPLSGPNSHCMPRHLEVRTENGVGLIGPH